MSRNGLHQYICQIGVVLRGLRCCLHIKFHDIIGVDYANSSQMTQITASHRNTFDKNCSSRCCEVPRAAALGRVSPMLNVDVKKPNGNAPMPNERWNPLSPNPKSEIEIQHQHTVYPALFIYIHMHSNYLWLFCAKSRVC